MAARLMPQRNTNAPPKSAILRTIPPPPGLFPRITYNIPIWARRVNTTQSKGSGHLAKPNQMTVGLASSIWPVHDKDD